ncbi:unnamed protein product [Paramecium octaurelia]|uniref:Uncharacterized protein n=1 Tax=Paramecium octaurelia TaxID=43137 RepID=A0A8S1X7M2_PAROT|nr:unnamed protein product [Paramecium octaurelia]
MPDLRILTIYRGIKSTGEIQYERQNKIKKLMILWNKKINT